MLIASGDNSQFIRQLGRGAQLQRSGGINDILDSRAVVDEFARLTALFLQRHQRRHQGMFHLRALLRDLVDIQLR